MSFPLELEAVSGGAGATPWAGGRILRPDSQARMSHLVSRFVFPFLLAWRTI